MPTKSHVTPREETQPPRKNPAAGTVVFIRSDTVGRGDDELGANLMINFLHHLSETDDSPSFIVMMNAGVKLVAGGSEVLDSLEQLEKKGTTILACGTCLSFFGIEEKQMVGKASNMPEIITTLLDASKVVTI